MANIIIKNEVMEKLERMRILDEEELFFKYDIEINLIREAAEASKRCKMFMENNIKKAYYENLACNLENFENRLYEILRIKKIYETALKNIIKHEGKVCKDFELCKHESCRSSCSSWFIADQALKDAEGNNLYSKE